MKMTLGAAIKTLRESQKLTQAELAEAEGVGLDAGNLSRVERGRQSINHKQIEAIARRLGVSPSDLYRMAEGAPLIRAAHPDDPAADDEIRVPESRVFFSGGHGHIINWETVEEAEPATYRISWFQKERINPVRARRFRVIGNSMEPLLFPGDAILVNLEETQVKEGLIYVFRHGEELKVKKLIPRADGCLVLRSINREEYPDDVVPADQVDEQITIIGRVRDKSGRGGLGASVFESQDVPEASMKGVRALSLEAMAVVSNGLEAAGKTVTGTVLKKLTEWVFAELEKGKEAASVERSVPEMLDRLREKDAESKGSARHGGPSVGT